MAAFRANSSGGELTNEYIAKEAINKDKNKAIFFITMNLRICIQSN
jgi:hypothetical protein